MAFKFFVVAYNLYIFVTIDKLCCFKFVSMNVCYIIICVIVYTFCYNTIDLTNCHIAIKEGGQRYFNICD